MGIELRPCWFDHHRYPDFLYFPLYQQLSTLLPRDRTRKQRELLRFRAWLDLLWSLYELLMRLMSIEVPLVGVEPKRVRGVQKSLGRG